MLQSRVVRLKPHNHVKTYKHSGWDVSGNFEGLRVEQEPQTKNGERKVGFGEGAVPIYGADFKSPFDYLSRLA